MSSTAIVLPVLADRKRLGTSAGRTIFSVLLFQDLMVAPLLFLVTILGAHHDKFDSVLLYTVLPASIGIAVVALAGGGLVLRPLFHSSSPPVRRNFLWPPVSWLVVGTAVIFRRRAGFRWGLAR